MPYNNAAIPPPADITGQASLPLARVKRIISLDEDIAQCSNNAAFVITVATEMFIRYLAEQGHNVAKSERKPRRNIQYNDLATAVARIDNLDFLSDVIPKTTTYKQFKEKKAKEARNGVHFEAGQTTLDGKKPAQNGTGSNGYGYDGYPVNPSMDSSMNGAHNDDVIDVDDEDEEEDVDSGPVADPVPMETYRIGQFVHRIPHPNPKFLGSEMH